MKTRTYSELAKLFTFEERYEYLKLGGSVGSSTFGFDRYINQAFYNSSAWKSVRNFVISRDNGCDLGVAGYEIHAELLVHHINPIDKDDIVDREEWILSPEFLITTTKRTHNAIHYGDAGLLKQKFTPRAVGDTRLW